jgi:hypothetical protein
VLIPLAFHSRTTVRSVGWAVVAGALIALAASVTTSVITGWLDRSKNRADLSRGHREEQRLALLDCTAQLGTMARTHAHGTSAERTAAEPAFQLACARLEFSTVGDDARIARMARRAARSLLVQPDKSPSTVIAYFAEFSSAWFRSDMTAKQAGEKFKQLVIDPQP